jgi:cytochrome c oxidase subunit 2
MSIRKRTVCVLLFVLLILIAGCGSAEPATKEDASTVETTPSVKADPIVPEKSIAIEEDNIEESTEKSTEDTAKSDIPPSESVTNNKNASQPATSNETTTQKVTTNSKAQAPKQQSAPAQTNGNEVKEKQVVVVEPVAPAATPAPVPTPAPTAAPTAAPAPAPEPVVPQQVVINAEPRVIKIEVTNWAWKLDPVPLVVGSPVIFKVNVIEGEHGFQITGTPINEVIQEGKSYEIAWTPEKAGTFTIRCSVLCGSGHSAMRSQLQVKE